jgi:hypothetical protein
MRSLPLIRTEYWNLDTTPPTPRSGATALSESLTDVENYLLPQAQNHAANLYTWGVADGLSVSAVPAQSGLTITPGVALDAAGHLIALAAHGVAIVDPTVDPHEVRNIPTVPVGLDGLVLSTAGLSGEYFVTLTWREVFRAGFGGTAPILLHAPWARLLGVAGFPDIGDQVILARVSLAATGLVTALAAAGRRLVGLPASRLELRCPRTTLTPSLRVDHVPTVELRARPDGGLDLNLLSPNGPPRPALSVEGLTGHLALAPQGGNVGIGTTAAPTQKLEVVGTVKATAFQGHGLEVTGNVGIGTTSPGAPLEIRGSGDPLFLINHTGAAGHPALWLQQDGAPKAFLWWDQANNRLNLGTPTTNPIVSLQNNGNVGIGTATPQGKLEVNGDIRAGNSDLYFTKTDHNHTGIGNAPGFAAIENAADLGALLILGRAGTANGRYVRLWDYLQVNGGMSVTNGIHATGGNQAAVTAINSDTLAGSFWGNVAILGELFKAGGGFKIDDPRDPANQYLSHSFVESPEMLNMYRGNITTDDRGEATIDLPAYFAALNRDFSYHLTVIGQMAQAAVSTEIRDNRFTVQTDRPGITVSWLVIGVRQDAWANAHRIPVEEAKPQAERGFYLHPEVYEQPATRSIMHLQYPELLQRAAPNP